jgi:hypothetical protein
MLSKYPLYGGRKIMTTLEQLNARGQGYLPGLIGIEFLSLVPGRPGLAV